ncbi:MAG: alkaline phosphatase [Kiritimatiellales bacterium]
MRFKTKTGIFKKFLLIFLFAGFGFGQTPKYVFLMIGDGMSGSHRRLFHDQFGPMTLGTFEKSILTGTDNVQGKTTDSAASGTALACGIKTCNGAIGMNADKVPVTGLAKILQNRGYKIGIISSVGINDATPAAHYGNREHRSLHAGLLSDMAASNFDFFGISSVLYPKGYTEAMFEARMRRSGYEFCRGAELFNLDPAKKNAVMSSMDPDWPAQTRNGPSLAEYTREAAKLLKNDIGFFMMVEGGAIDHRAHNNDSAGIIREMAEFDLAVAAAVEFYNQYPAETLVVVTADHDTGGIIFEEDKSAAPGFWTSQTMKLLDMEPVMEQMKNSGAGLDALVEWCVKNTGLEDLTADETARIMQAANYYVHGGLTAEDKMTGYGRYNPLAVEVMRVRDTRNGFRFTTFGHTSRKIITNAKGSGAGLFTEPLENSDIPHRIATAMLGRNDELISGAKTIPFPPNEAMDYIALQSATPESLMLRAGLMSEQNLRFTLSAGENVVEQKEFYGASGRIIFSDLTPDTDYTVRCESGAGKVQKLTARTLKQPAGKKLMSLAIISDPHVSLFPDNPASRMHSLSVDILTGIVNDLNQSGCELLLLPGDLTDKSREEELEAVENVLSGARMPLIATKGNHDQAEGGFAEKWEQLFGAPAGIKTISGIQFVWLDTNDGRLNKPWNAGVIKQLDETKPAVIISHYQLVPDKAIAPRDADAGIHDAKNFRCRSMLKKIARSRSIIYVGHKNIASIAMLGNAPQFNCPQTTQFPNGYLAAEIYESGIQQWFVPGTDPYREEYSRRLDSSSQRTETPFRDANSFTVWNRFVPWPKN